MSQQHHVILGAGISGLSLAWYLKKQQPDTKITIIDAAPRAGGWIRTIDDNGFLFELGPRSCRMRGHGQTTLDLVHELGLDDQVVAPTAAAQKKYLYYRGQVRPIPSNPLKLLLSPLGRGIPSALWSDLTTAKNNDEETIYSFFSRRFGSAIADRFVDPMITGIYAGDPKQLSMNACFPCMKRIEQEHGSLIKGMFKSKRQKGMPLFSFKEGMETLPKALAHQLEGHLHLSTKATTLTIEKKQVHIECSNGKVFTADQLYAAIPAHKLSSLLPSISPIATADVAIVNIGYTRNVLDREGFGYLVPASEKQKILGVVWDSSVFPQQKGCSRLTVMIGGTRNPDLVDQSDRTLTAIAMNSLAEHLNIRALPDIVSVHRAKEAIPQYTLGHQKRVANLRKELPPHVHVLGSSYDGVSINDCIYQAKELAETITN